MDKDHVVIIGGGFGGIAAAKKLAKAAKKVTLIDKQNHHLFQPLLYQVATAALAPSDIAFPLREIFKNYPNVTVLLGDITSVNTEIKSVSFSCGETLSYSHLIIAVGSTHSYYGNDSWAQSAPGLKTLSDAIKIQKTILSAFEKAERHQCIKKKTPHLTFVVIGAGPTGVELAGSIIEAATKTLKKEFRSINTKHTKVYLIEGSSRTLPSYDKQLSARALLDLQKLGCEVLLDSLVTNISKDSVTIGDKKIESHNIFWAAGNKAAPLISTINSPKDKNGRTIVDPYLRLPTHTDIYVIGDAACVLSRSNNPLPSVAPVAMQQGRYVAKHLLGKTHKPFSYFDKGSLSTIGKWRAVGYVGNVHLKGSIAWLGWLALHIFYLMGFRNKIRVGFEWATHYLLGSRSSRIFTREE